MCRHCAFRSRSQEISAEEEREYLVWECMHRTFYCHETMFQTDGNAKSNGSFDPARKPDGSPASIEDHQICAGFAKIYGSEFRNQH